MLLGYHKSWTENALDAATISVKKKLEISIGCTVNDLCEISNETYLFILLQDLASPAGTAVLSTPYESKDGIYQSFGTMPFLFGGLALYQSHFGSLASLHGMAKKPQELPQITRQEIISWFDFLNSVAVGSFTVKPVARFYNDSTAIRNLFFRCRKIEYRQLFDSEDPFAIKHRAIGMMCHLIEDLFTSSHCERNSNKEIRKFYSYELQDKTKHRLNDHAAIGMEQELAAQCKLCIDNTAKNIAYDYRPILTLSQDAQLADGGQFA